MPDEIGELKELEWQGVTLDTLELSNNQLTTLPDEIGELRELVQEWRPETGLE